MKTYINGITVKEIEWQYGSFFNISVNIDKIKEHANEKGYVNMTISKRKEVWNYWETHTAVLNEYKPKETNKQEIKEDDFNIPF